MLARKLRRSLSYANVMATIAVVVALGGTAYAAATITGAEVVDESLTGADILNKSIQGGDLAGASVGNNKVMDNSLTGAKMLDNSLTGPDVNESTLGKVPSATTADAAAKAPVEGYTVVQKEHYTYAGAQVVAAPELCPTGMNVLGGGVWQEYGKLLWVNASFPTGPGAPDPYSGSTASGWTAYVTNTGQTIEKFHVYAICAKTA